MYVSWRNSSASKAALPAVRSGTADAGSCDSAAPSCCVGSTCVAVTTDYGPPNTPLCMLCVDLNMSCAQDCMPCSFFSGFAPCRACTSTPELIECREA